MLNEKQVETLREYARAADGGAFALQHMPGASELEDSGLLRWCGTNWGTHFYAITPAGRAALAPSSDT